MIKKWWMESIGYQIYPKSFKDTNHDGIGDLNGIIEKLPYLHDLGVDLIWICPVYDSPMDDNGYDVRDFYNIDPMFGDLDDMKRLIHQAKQLNMKIVMDYVLNHTSDEHPWFLESRKSIDNPYRDYYIWQEGKEKDGKLVEPTNWGSFFGGSCWNYDALTNSYYMKIFSNKMPDLNWKNPIVRQEMIKVGQWWLDLGIDGFRIDAVSHLDRAPFEDVLNATDRYPLDYFKFSNLPKVHDYLKEMNEKLFTPNDCLTIGEVGGQASIESAVSYAGFDSKQMSMVFNFDHDWCNNLSDIDSYDDLVTNVIDLKKVFIKWQEGFKGKGWLPLNWLNHDQPRLMSQYGRTKFFNQSGKMLATLMYMMRGTPFVYQGEEIGMMNYPFKNVEEFNDISSKNYYQYLTEEQKVEPSLAIKKVAMRSRDNGRTPIQWDHSQNAGFSDVKPWMPIHPNYVTINVQDELNDEDSIINHYKLLFQLRKTSKYHEVITYGDIKFLELDDPNLVVYKRFNENQTLLVICSFLEEEAIYDLSNVEIKSVVLSNEIHKIMNHKIHMNPYGSVVLEIEENK
ncbi:MAG: alpha-glucosidase [Acholeplasmataceae bacterium]